MFEAEVLHLLDAELVDRVQVLLDAPPIEREVFVHDDLGPEHVLMDEGGRPVGIIDFEDATIGDPEVDRMSVQVVAGRPLTERMWFYRCRSVLHDLVYFTGKGDDGKIPELVAELRRRLDSRPGQ